MSRGALAAVVVGASLLVAASMGCSTYGDLGPEFVPVAKPIQGFGVVYVYRPRATWGAEFPFHVSLGAVGAQGIGDRELDVYRANWAAFVVPIGDAELRHPGPSPLSLKVVEGKPIYVRVVVDGIEGPVEINPSPIWKVVAVDEATALDEMSGLPLAPGGKARYPDTAVDATPSASAAPETPSEQYNTSVVTQANTKVLTSTKNLLKACGAERTCDAKHILVPPALDGLAKATNSVQGMVLPKEVGDAWRDVARASDKLQREASGGSITQASVIDLQAASARFDTVWREFLKPPKPR